MFEQETCEKNLSLEQGIVKLGGKVDKLRYQIIEETLMKVISGRHSSWPRKESKRLLMKRRF